MGKLKSGRGGATARPKKEEPRKKRGDKIDKEQKKKKNQTDEAAERELRLKQQSCTQIKTTFKKKK